MGDKPTRQSIFTDAARIMRATFEEIRKNVPHHGEAGGEGEEIIRNFLNTHLPSRFRASSGFIIDRANTVSGQTDVIVYDALNCPAYRVSERGMILPNDNVAAVVEVKFQLTATMLRSSLAKIHELKTLTKTPIAPNTPGITESSTYGIIFGFESDLSADALLRIWHEEFSGDHQLHSSASLIVILDRAIATTVMDIPGSGPAPVSFQTVFLCPAGSKVGITYFEYGERVLDAMMRLLLSHLSLFRHRIDHPGFDFDQFGPCPTRWVGHYPRDGHVEYMSLSKRHSTR